MVLWWGSLPRPSSEEQFQRWSRNWCWHSWMATWMPCRAEAVTSGLRTHIRIWRLLRPANLRHTELGVSTGSPATFRLRISLHSTLQRQKERERERGRVSEGEVGGGVISQIQSSMWQREVFWKVQKIWKIQNKSRLKLNLWGMCYKLHLVSMGFAGYTLQ